MTSAAQHPAPHAAATAAPGDTARQHRIALVQLASPREESRAERIERVAALLRAHPGAELYVLPELWSAGYFSFERYAELAESLTGPTVTMVRELARELGAAIHLGSIIERDAAGALHNTAVLVDAAGEIAQTYRKIHVFGYESLEAELLTPGTSLSVVPATLGATASITCYDLRFPGLWQELSERGAETVIVPAAWPAARREHWRVLTQARAIEHQMWVVAVNACGAQGEVELGGFSRIVDPAGRVIAELGAEEEVRIVTVEAGRPAAVRAEFPVIADRLDAAHYRGLTS
ncbi:nitrilase-related carbon-nitrogen hydrolase [Leucobacter chromiireducens]|uniref:nitrilase-related carbon-nitrogen hydrolase n=1 Tax=Leucobacter chromiireducens TaxID=283877 RepID=UPI000F6398AF|nr:nitrilase-related carbon-nitrogen hydrolase [Leucobacter chromiireducens]